MQSFGKEDILELVATPAILGAGQFAYDIYIGGYSSK
jgi:hypothetical protein